MTSYIPLLKKSCYLLFFSCLSSSLFSQFSGLNMLEFQYGKIPTEVNDEFPSIYDRAIVNYRFKKFTASVTLENYFTKFSDRNYAALTQYSLRYKGKHWEFKLGNFYETLGRGSLLRAFEVRGSILEDIGLRSRNYFHRDLLGASVKYKTKRLIVQAMYGDALNNLVPPNMPIAQRRTNRFASFSTEYRYFKKHKAEVLILNFQGDATTTTENFLSGIFKGPITKKMNYYLEYSQGVEDTDKSSLFAGLTGLVGAFSYNLEYRNYQNIVVGTGINEPPAAVKQQTYRMLNRSIHVSNPDSEDGYQLDLYYSFDNGSVLNLNHARARNRFFGFEPVFQQFFLEWSSNFSKDHDYKLYLDYSKDDLKGEPNRYSLGFYNAIKVNEKWRFLPELEVQQIDRFEGAFWNQFYSLGFSYNNKLNFNFELELTKDPFLLEDGNERTLYPGFNVRYKHNRNHTAQMFLGQRRGGPACTAGVCYEILDFRGLEFRLTSRF